MAQCPNWECQDIDEYGSNQYDKLMTFRTCIIKYFTKRFASLHLEKFFIQFLGLEKIISTKFQTYDLYDFGVYWVAQSEKHGYDHQLKDVDEIDYVLKKTRKENCHNTISEQKPFHRSLKDMLILFYKNLDFSFLISSVSSQSGYETNIFHIVLGWDNLCLFKTVKSQENARIWNIELQFVRVQTIR